jgi:hypothetical protein
MLMSFLTAPAGFVAATRARVGTRGSERGELLTVTVACACQRCTAWSSTAEGTLGRTRSPRLAFHRLRTSVVALSPSSPTKNGTSPRCAFVAVGARTSGPGCCWTAIAGDHAGVAPGRTAAAPIRGASGWATE